LEPSKINFISDLIPKIDLEKLNNLYSTLLYLRNIKNRVNTSNLIEQIISSTNYYSILAAEFLGTQKISNLKKLITTIKNLEDKGIYNLGTLIKSINDFTLNDIREGEATIARQQSNVVKIMTIHKAKGLEFPFVIIPDISKKPYIGTSNFTFDRDFLGIGLKIKDENGELQNTTPWKWIYRNIAKKELAENKRLLYVATTRARDYLIYSGNLSQSKNINLNNWSSWLTNYYDINKTKNCFINLNNSSKAKITVDVTDIEKTTKKVPLIYKYKKNILNSEIIPGKTNMSFINNILEQTKPITEFRTLKKRFIATEFSDYITCPKKYELKNIVGIPESSIEFSSNITKGQNIGNITHKFLEKWDLKDISISSLLSEIKDKDQIIKINNFIKNFKQNSIYKEIIESEESKNELSLTFKYKKYIIEGVIDKLYKSGDNWIILDYKTDNITKEEVAKRAKTYELQLGIYALGLDKILNATPKKLILFFLTPGVAYTINCNSKYIKNLEKKINDLISNIEKGKFAPITKNPKECPYCSYKNLCRKS